MTHKNQWLQHGMFEFKDERFEMEKKHLLVLKESLESVLSGVDIDIALERFAIGFQLKVSSEEEEWGSYPYKGSIFFYYGNTPSNYTVQGVRLSLDSNGFLDPLEYSYPFDFETMTVPETEIKKIAVTIQERFDCRPYTFDFETMTVSKTEIKKIVSTLQERFDRRKRNK